MSIYEKQKRQKNVGNLRGGAFLETAPMAKLIQHVGQAFHHPHTRQLPDPTPSRQPPTIRARVGSDYNCIWSPVTTLKINAPNRHTRSKMACKVGLVAHDDRETGATGLKLTAKVDSMLLRQKSIDQFRAE